MKKTILIVEADDVKYGLLSKQLSASGYAGDDITRYLSMDECLIPDDSLECIIASIPALSTEDFYSLKMLHYRFIHIPILVLSDNRDLALQAKAVSKGAQDVLINGDYSVAELDKAIAYATARKSLTHKIENAYIDYERHFENGPLPMWVIDAQTLKFLLVNNAAVEKYGYSKEEFLQMTAMDIRPKEDVPLMLENFRNRVDGSFDDGYWRHRKKSGDVFFVHVYAHNTVFNHTAGRLCMLVDVNEKVLTHKRNSELASLIKAQKEQLDSILYSISDAIWSRRADTLELVYANNAYYKLFDASPGLLKTDKEQMLSSVYPDDMPLFQKAMNDVIINGKTEIIYRYVHRDGNIKVLKVQAELKKGTDGQPGIINGVTNDITQEKELYDAIRNSEQKLRATINNTKDLIWSVNADLEILFCNEPYRDFVFSLTGVMPEEGSYVLEGSTSESFITTRRNDYSRALSGDSFTTVTEENYKGDTLYLEISSSPIINHEGKIAGANCIARDITVLRKQLLKIQQQNEKLKEVAEIQSHKVRGPVASILGLIPLFDYRTAGSDYNADILQKLELATTDLDQVIREIVYSINGLDRT